jgi:hypothetical protein
MQLPSIPTYRQESTLSKPSHVPKA